MITVNENNQSISQAFIDAVRASSPSYLSRFVVNGSDLSCVIDSWQVTKGSCAGDTFSVGDVIGSTFTAEVRELNDNIKGEVIKVMVGVDVGGSYEYIQIGEFYVSNVKKTYYKSTITAYGYTVSRTKYAFVPPASQTLGNIIAELEIDTGCTITADASIDLTEEITAPMNNLTAYQVLGLVASVCGCFVADTHDGEIAIKKFPDTGSLAVTTGMMLQLPNAEETDFEITGVECVVGEEYTDEETETEIPAIKYTYGTVNVSMANPNMTEDIFDNILVPNLVGYTYRPATINLALGDPRLEGDDVLSVTDIDGSTYLVPCHSVTHSYAGGFSTSVSSAKATMQADDIGTSTPLQNTLVILQSAVRGSKVMASEAYQIASDTNQYFWFNGTGTDTGAHITEVPQDDFTDPTSPDYHSGGNLLARSNGIAVRNGLTELAQFGASAIQIGATGGGHTTIQPSGMQIYASDGTVELANIGYGETQGESGATDSPFYTFGVRGGSTASDYDQTATYSVGDLCVYNDVLYVCIVGITTPEAWDRSKWQIAIGSYSFGEGYNVIASGFYSHAEGEYTTAIGRMSHAEGQYTIARGRMSHAEGQYTTASGSPSHAEGRETTASGSWSHAEGRGTTASRHCAHAEGIETVASAYYSHAQNMCTIAQRKSQTAIGEYNVLDTAGADETVRGDYALIIGNGTSSTRSNALTVDWNGRVNQIAQTSIADNNPAELKLSVHQTDNDVTSSGYIRVYDDHDAYNYGTNMVIQSNGNMIIGSGESAQSFYDGNIISHTSEHMYLTSDAQMYFITNCGTPNGIADRKTVVLNTTPSLYSTNTGTSSLGTTTYPWNNIIGDGIRPRYISSHLGYSPLIWVDLSSSWNSEYPVGMNYDGTSVLNQQSSDKSWMQNVIKSICAKYPNKKDVTFRGQLYPNSKGWFEIFVYDTSDLLNGYPSCVGTFRKYDTTLWMFSHSATNGDWRWWTNKPQLISKTWTSQNYVNETSFNRLYCYDIGNAYIVHGNMNVTQGVPYGTTYTIGKFSFPINALVQGCQQTPIGTSGSINVSILTDGTVQIYNYNSTTTGVGGARFSIVLAHI